MNNQRMLKINECFLSIQGEGPFTGMPTFFIRLTGCPLRCHYCDTAYAFYHGKRIPIDTIIQDTYASQASYVCVTGGEPLAQQGCFDLLRQLANHGFQVSLETSGAIDSSKVDQRVARVLDIKTPGSGEVMANYWPQFSQLRQRDIIKIVICNFQDFLWAKDMIFRLNCLPHQIYFSPCHDKVHLADLAQWILDHKLNIRLQNQLHKSIWGDMPGR